MICTKQVVVLLRKQFPEANYDDVFCLIRMFIAITSWLLHHGTCFTNICKDLPLIKHWWRGLGLGILSLTCLYQHQTFMASYNGWLRKSSKNDEQTLKERELFKYFASFSQIDVLDSYFTIGTKVIFMYSIDTQLSTNVIHQPSLMTFPYKFELFHLFNLFIAHSDLCIIKSSTNMHWQGRGHARSYTDSFLRQSSNELKIWDPVMKSNSINSTSQAYLSSNIKINCCCVNWRLVVVLDEHSYSFNYIITEKNNILICKMITSWHAKISISPHLTKIMQIFIFIFILLCNCLVCSEQILKGFQRTAILPGYSHDDAW